MLKLDEFKSKEYPSVGSDEFGCGQIMDEYYQYLENNFFKMGIKITKVIYDSLDDGKRYHYSKKYNKCLIVN